MTPPVPKHNRHETELVGRLGWLIALRWLAALAMAAFGSVVVFFYYGSNDWGRFADIAALACAVGAYNVVFLFWWRSIRASSASREQRARLFANIQIGVDLIVLTAYAMLTGGCVSPVLSHYVFHVVFASILLSTQAAYCWAGIGIALGGLVILTGAPPEQFAIAPEGVVVGRVPLMIFAGFAALLAFSTYLTTSIMKRLRLRERQAHEYFANVQRKADLLSQAYRDLQATQTMQTSYMRRVSHELRSPLSAVSSSLQVVADGYVGTVPARAAEIVVRSRDRIEELLRLVNDLLALARARTARPRQYLEPVSVPIVAGEVLDLLAERAADKGVTLVNSVPAELPTILADREGIVQLMTNLTANAVKYTEQGGRVTVSGCQDGEWLAVSVADTGIGIQPDEIPHLFEEFYRTKQGREFQPVGTGLGLSIVKAIVDQHDGQIAVESEPGVGTTFVVRLPIDGPHRNEAEASSEDATARDPLASVW